MIIPDTNLLFYAYDAESPEHRKAREWWAGVLSGTEPVGLPWIVLLAFTRLMTHPQICRDPLTTEEVRTLTAQWFACPHLRLVQLSDQAVPVFFDLLDSAGMGGNLSTDTQIAVCARELSGIVYSNDRDFDRFPGIKRINPLK